MQWLSISGTELYAELQRRYTTLSEQEQENFLLQPEVSNRLLKHPKDSATPAFFFRSLEAEVAKHTLEYDHAVFGGSLWSANGDFLISWNTETPEFSTFESPRLLETTTIDFFSPWCLGLSHADINEDSSAIIEPYSLSEAEHILCLLGDAVEPIEDHDKLICLIRQFNNVLLIKKQFNGQRQQSFISGSDGNFIGRTHVMNPDIVPVEFIVEVLVHEAIHTVLYMIEEVESWMPDDETALRIGISVVSDWSGNKLSIRSYFQAIFVWFGLYNFWDMALRTGRYDRLFAEKRLDFIRNGFAKLRLERIIQQYGLKVSDRTMETIKVAKKTIL